MLGPSQTYVAPYAHSFSATDEGLLVAHAQRDPAAFEPLYEAYFTPIYRYCYYRLGSAPAAEDAASVTFMRALEALPRYRPGAHVGSFRSWLFAIAHNVAANHHRDATRRDARPLEAASVVPDSSPSPEEHAMAAEDAHTILSLLAQLSSDQRQVVELRLAGLTDREIAHVLGRSQGAIRTAHYRAVLQLRAVLGAQRGGIRHAG